MPGLLSFHAHPDDESISMGGTLAEYAEQGRPVTVVTATRGEEGEIHNRDDADEIRHRLGEVREAEERAALAVLGIDDLEYLGYRDSGMMGTPGNGHPHAFWNADFMEAVERLVRVIRSRRPDVVTAYDPYGGYGHPDHIQTHRIGTAAFFGAADIGRFPPVDGEEPWQPARLYWVTWSRERMRRIRRRLAQDLGAAERADEPEPSSGTLASHITTHRDVTPWAKRKHLALLEHVTQFSAESWIRSMPDEHLLAFLGEEVFLRVFSTVDGDPADPDLFAGL
jgi:N-acetyl-1-D-myo-inositol-2-amino-2-deoxy-alpha-D-glucopyranoside deacetylase